MRLQQGHSNRREDGLLSATRYVASLPQVNIDELVENGVRLVLLDRDNTCLPRDRKRCPEEVAAWIACAREAGMRVVLVSNNFHRTQVLATATELGCEALTHAMKPMPFALWKAMRMVGEVPERTVMIGDQVFTDVLAGNLAGVATVLVHPQTVRDLWYTLLLRRVEKIVLRGIKFQGE